MPSIRRIFQISATADQFQRLRPDYPQGEYREIDENTDVSSWRAPPLVVENPHCPRTDFVRSLGFGLVCPRSLVTAHPEFSISKDCDLLPVRIAHESQEYVSLRPRRMLIRSDIIVDDPVRGKGKVRELEAVRSFLFWMPFHSDMIFAAIVDESRRASHDFMLFALKYTGLEWLLIAES